MELHGDFSSHGLLAAMAMAEDIADKLAAPRARRRLSIVRLSQCVLLADSRGFRPCSRPLGAGVASHWTPASRRALPAPAAINVAAAGPRLR
jgi:hypothetical protein